MRKNWFQRAMGIGLVLALTAGLCGCGGEGKKNENAALAKENVYKLSSIEFPDLGGDDYGIRSSACLNGMIYMVVQVYHWDEGNGDTDLKLISMKEDASEMEVVSLEMPAKETVAGYDGSDSDADDAEPEEAAAESEEPAAEDAESEEGDVAGKDEWDGIWENTSYYNYNFSTAGQVYAVKNYYYENSSDPDNYISVEKIYVCCWNVDGSLQWQHDVGSFGSEEEWIYLDTIIPAADGTLYLVLGGDKEYKITLDAQGNMSERIPVSEDVAEVLDRGSFYPREDGSLLVMYWDENWTKQYLVSYDIATDTLGEPVMMPAAFSYGGYNTMCAGRLSDLVYSDSSSIYTYNIGDEDRVKRMDFVNSDLMNPSFNVVIELDEQSFFGVFYENWEGSSKAGIFTYVKPEDIPDKSVLVLAGSYVNDELKKRVVDYNRASDQYRIVIKEYYSYNTYDDYQACYTQLNNDIVAGKMPDMLVTDGLPVENYAAKGLLADVGKLIENDEELSQVEFVQNVFDAYSIDGKLYYVIPYFYVGTMIAKTSLVGDRTSWTMDDAQKVLETMPEGAMLMGETTRSDFFSNVMEYCSSDFVDVATGKCDFNSQNFLEMMEYAKSLPEEYEYSDDYWEKYHTNYQTQYRDNRTLLCRFSFGSLKNLTYTINGRFGEDVTYIGFPTESGSGSYVYSYYTFALSSRSSYTDVAWDFLRYYLMDEYQSAQEWVMPIQKKYFMEFAEKAMERPYWLNEDGEKEYYDQTYYMNGEEIILPPLTKEQLDQAVDFIFSIDKSHFSNNNDILNIINEEMDGFFSGQKTAQDVAQIIQSRAQVYVDANR